MIYGFMHIYQANHWQTIVEEQIQKMIDSNLSVWMEKLFVGINGHPQHHFHFNLDYSKIDILYHLNIPELYEAMTLSFLRAICLTLDDEDQVFYIHTKGVSRGPKEQFTDWRHLMEYYVIERYEECQDQLVENDIVGVNWHLGEGYMGASSKHAEGTPVTPHFSGNFWWATAKYIKSLYPLYPLKSKYECEFWHGSGRPSVSELWRSGVYHHRNKYPRSEYEGKMNVQHY